MENKLASLESRIDELLAMVEESPSGSSKPSDKSTNGEKKP